MEKGKGRQLKDLIKKHIMNQNEKVIEDFYTAFQKKDYKGIHACYHPGIVFSDPVFNNLKGGEAKAMWHMLVVAGRDLEISFKNIHADENKGSCDWDAHYSFSRTGRKVHNVIHARFEFMDGKIIKHTDEFDFWKWSGMALGLSGKLLGWSSFIHNKVQATAQQNLRKFIQDHPEYNPDRI
jgi:ketosteroid isomerase-like protein